MNQVVGRARDGQGSIYRCNGLEVTSVWHFLFDPWDDNRYYIAYTDIGFARSLNKGKTWIHAAKGSPWSNTTYSVVFDPFTKGRIYGAASNRHDIPHWTHINDNTPRHSGGVIVSDNYAVNWRKIGRGLPPKPCTSIALDRANSTKDRLVLYVTMFEEGVYKSTDSGKTWVKKSKGLGRPRNKHALQVQVQPGTGDLYCSITAHRRGARDFPVPGGLWKSTDGGDSWVEITKGLNLTWPTYFAFHPTDSNIIYLSAATSPGPKQGGVYRTDNGGQSWTRVLRDEDCAKKRGPGYTHVMNVKLHPDNPDIVYACTSHGLFVSENAGKTWKWFTEIPFGSAQNVAFDPKDTKTMYVCTFGGGIWKGNYLPK